MSNFKEVKFEVSSPQQSNLVQSWLNKRGCWWDRLGTKQFITYFLNSKFLYVDESGRFFHGNDRECFNKNPYRLLNLDEITIMYHLPDRFRVEVVGKGEYRVTTQEYENEVKE